MTRWAAEFVCRRAIETFGTQVQAQIEGGPQEYRARVAHRRLNRAVSVESVAHWSDIQRAWVVAAHRD